MAAAAFQIVRHVEDDQRGQFQAEDRRGQNQVAPQVGAIQNQQQRVGLGDAGHGASQDIASYLFVFRARVQAVDAGQIHQDHFVMVMRHACFADALFHRDAREVGHFLAQAGEAIEERRFARVGRADDGDDVRTRALLRRRRSFGNRTTGAAVAIAHSLEALPGGTFSTGLDGRRMRCDAVSLRSATSEPSTRYTRGSPPGALRAGTMMWPGKKPEFHQAAGDVVGQIQAVQHTRFSLRKLRESTRSRCHLAQRLVRC